jgi:TonB-linked SusC/RagA family outer membrane protein
MKLKYSLLTFSLALFCAFAQGQTTISGKVTDSETGEPLIGANIVFVGTSIGTATDIDGTFTLEVLKGATAFEVSYTGYQTSVFVLDGKAVFDIALSPGELLNEVIVIGYGVIQKRDVTGAIESLKPKDKQIAQYDNLQDFLQGRATGVYVQSNGAELMSPNTVRIRGSNSLRGDNEPLYVVDGIIISSSTEEVADPLSSGNSYLAPQTGLTGINPQDIESIEILKDASATAIYGSRGANGVILITTKRGKEGDAKFNYKFSGRAGQATRLVEVLNTEDWIKFQNELSTTPKFYKYKDGSFAQYQTDTAYMEANSSTIPRLSGVNWYDDIFQTSFSQSHRLSVTGGKAKSDYFVAGGFSDAESFIPGATALQGDFLIKINQELGKRLTISPRISASFTDNKASKGTENLGSVNTSLIKQIVQGSPVLGFQDNNVTSDIEDAIDGPRAWLNEYDDDSKELRALASLGADYKIADSWTYRFLAGADYRTKKRQIWFGKATFRGSLANGEAGISELNRTRFNVDNTLNFNKKFNKNHSVNATIGVIFDGINVEQTSSTASSFANEDLRYNGISFGQVFEPIDYSKTEEAILSYLGRVNYSFKNRYLITASFRTDGASKFAKGHKYSFFPSAAFAWKIINEPFLKGNNFFSEAKLRLGVGRTGSQAIQPYQTFYRFGATANLISIGGGGSEVAIVPQNLANRDLIWETTEQANAGVDFGFLNDRFSGTLDIYYKKTKDLLQVLSIGPSAGFQTIVTNQGDLENRGFEVGLNANILQGALKWSVYGNLSINRNKIVNLGLPPTQYGTQTYSAYLGRGVSGGTVFKVPANIFIEGKPAGLFWGYKTNGIITTQEILDKAPSVQGVISRLGDVLYIDQNKDGNINDLDLTIIGDPNPDYTFGLGSELSFKGLSLEFFFNGVQGNDIANGNLGREDVALGSSSNIRERAYFGAYRTGKTDATHPRLNYPIQGDFTDRMIEDGSFFRLSYVSLSYDLPVKKLVKGIEAANIFVSGQNLLLFTDYSGFDPEVNSFSYDPTRVGIDWQSFPNQKAISFGINLDF